MARAQLISFDYLPGGYRVRFTLAVAFMARGPLLFLLYWRRCVACYAGVNCVTTETYMKFS